VPAVLKNAFDWGTRPPGHNVWAGQPGAIGGASGGAIGTAVAQSQLRNTLVVLEVILMGQPELYFQFKPGIISEAYDITDEKARAFLSSWVNKFELWIRRIASDA
jgi:chromate reductase